MVVNVERNNKMTRSLEEIQADKKALAEEEKQALKQLDM